jgi:catechol 2,3-dioxygenase-like lactoylglutathione lyase family enzyme
MDRPGLTNGMRHVALYVNKFSECEWFYCTLLGMEVEWRPDDDNVYLTNGNDNLALHRVEEASRHGQLDHIGFFINDISKIDEWYRYLEFEGVELLNEPRTHRDGARSFYCLDPSGIRVQMIYHPPIAEADKAKR